MGTLYNGISTPKSPRATIIPSAILSISSILIIASPFSIFAITGILDFKPTKSYLMRLRSFAFL
ncbi:MAG: hypothetical protein KAR38_10595, partial [Calditrichia bacterium]|nr:hypothetical protein [Calditrichia bacterium]